MAWNRNYYVATVAVVIAESLLWLYPRAREALDRLFIDKRVSARWRVVLTYSDADNPDTTFSLEPEQSGAQRLGQLQADARAIAEGLEVHF